ncbi:hypothetical protein GCM10023346_00300 [Arthrobacter gyeryongensis]|uniref:Uncharacterized protein n=1 Tax=Arthrobacter gyeryongensis TaxID=1650592 RepID=A0ABP9RYN8_9MICC
MNETADASANLIGSLAGAIFGAAIGGSEGAIIGAIAAPAVEETGRHILASVLSFRERKRIDTALNSAGQQVRSLYAEGYKLRADDFWQARGGFPPPAQEVLEAVLLAAKRDPEERKATYMGRMFAHIAFDDGISPSAAHWAVTTAEALSWSQFQLLAVVARAEQLDVNGIVVGKSGENWDSYALHCDLRELGIDNRHLIFGGEEKTWNKISLPSSALQTFHFGSGGTLLHGLLGLEGIPIDDLVDVVTRLRAPISG